MTQKPAKAQRPVQGLRSILRFVGLTVLIALALSWVATPLIGERFDLTWWKILRRCASIAALVSLGVCVRWFERSTLSRYGFAWRELCGPAGKRQVLAGVVLGGLALAVTLGAGLVADVWRVAVSPDQAKLWRLLAGFVPASLLIGWLEELIFRGFLLQHLLSFGRAAAVLASSALYSAVHLKSPSLDLLTGLELGGLLLLGMVLCAAALRTQRLYLAIGLHAVLAYGARVNKTLISFGDPSLAWLVGTSRLVNGLVGWAVLAIVGVVILRWATPPQQGGVMHGRA
ncbi:MAG: CPBP family intramembrane metalloprotease [Candidatus Omnitrophica bacterium]|nr:CPBP family intramembrane metalloprotease [Candidatus Omnitrophota bacterium]